MTEQMKQMSAMDPVTAFWLSEPFWRAALLVFIIVIGLRGIVDAIWTAWQTENTTALLSDYLSSALAALVGAWVLRHRARKQAIAPPAA